MGRYVIGISGASGAAYARRVISVLVLGGHETHLVITPPGARLLHDELGMEGVDVAGLCGAEGPEDPRLARVVRHNHRDIGAVIASGSFRHDGMAVVPCSSHTLNAIAHGLGDNLLTRAAACTLKERRRLVLLHREAPLTLMDIESMRQITLAGGDRVPGQPGVLSVAAARGGTCGLRRRQSAGSAGGRARASGAMGGSGGRRSGRPVPSRA